MAKRLAINGFGRIGRMALRLAYTNKDLDIVAINDLGDRDTMLHLLKYDSVHGKFPAKVEKTEKGFTVDGKEILALSEKDPSKLPWKDLQVDVVLEATGIFTSFEKCKPHLDAGAKRVLISAPAKGSDVPTIVYGINHKTLKPENTVISGASCTTNCLAPVAKVLLDNFGIEHGFMTTIHSYTNDQRILDLPHKDLRRARAAGASMIPTTTGAAKAVGLVLPELKGKLDGMAIRVPTPNVSLVDLVAVLKKDVTKEEVNAALKKAAAGELKGILNYCEEPLVSIDFNGELTPSTVDALSTAVLEKRMVKILAWYDNETGYTNQFLRLAAVV